MSRVALAASLFSIALVFVLTGSAAAQSRAGVVTNVEGQAAVTHTARPPAPLRTKDDVYARDRIATAEASRARMLLGGTAVVTVRERSVFTITEQPGVATIEISAGRLAVSVAPDRLRPGERIDIKTPNAITAVRGTVVVTEVSGSGPGVDSRVTLLTGSVEVQPLDPGTGTPLGAPVSLRALQRLAVTGANPPGAPQAISRAEADAIAAGYTFTTAPAVVDRDVVDQQVREGAARAAAVAPIRGGTESVSNEALIPADSIRARTNTQGFPPPAAPPPPPSFREGRPGLSSGR